MERAIIRAKKRGIDIRVILDESQVSSKYHTRQVKEIKV